MQIFGFEIQRKKKNDAEIGNVITPTSDDGTAIFTSSSSSYYGMVMDIEGIIKNENDLIRRYREVAQYADCDAAIEDIVNESITSDDDQPIQINLDELKVSDPIKKKIRDEFQNIMRLLKFEEKGHEIFRSWYIDGRLYYNILLDTNNVKSGIQELRFIDPRKIRKIKTIKKERTAAGVDVIKDIEEYYLYNDKGITEQTTQGVKLSIDSVIYCPSGLMDSNTGMMMSHLHKAVKPVNQLKMIEDAVVIYRISRAPERRIFYIDVGNLPKLKAEQYVNDIMNKFRNKIVYDATTGETRDDRKHLSMMEDFWMPRREGGKGTEITTLPGGQNLGEIQDIQYFQQKLYQALNVPIGRLQQTSGFNLGRSTEITREELKFNKFITRVRKKFANLFTDALRVQLVAKGIIRPEEWDDMRQYVRYDFQKDNYFSELKDNEILLQRIQMLQQMDPYIGKYYSQAWITKNVLRIPEEEQKEIDKEIQAEKPMQIDYSDHMGTMDGTRQAAMQDQLPEPQNDNTGAKQ
jgi:hypothetical protein